MRKTILLLPVAIAFIAVLAFALVQLDSSEAGDAPAVMSLEINGEKGKVEVDVGSSFKVSVIAKSIPASGYLVAQAWIQWGNSLLTFKDSTTTWPDCESETKFADNDAQNASRGCQTYLNPPIVPSFHQGELFSFILNCPTAKWSDRIDLLPAGDPEVGTSGALFIDGAGAEIIPDVSGVVVNCVNSQTETPTATPTTTPTNSPTNTPTNTPTLTITPTPTPTLGCRETRPPAEPNEPAPSMSLRVYCDKAKTGLVCDIGVFGRKCEVEPGSNFVVEVVASGPPAGGYSAFRLIVRYSENVNLIDQEGFRESKSPRCDIPFESRSPGRYRFSCKAVPPLSGDRTDYNGALANLHFVCKGPGQIDLVGGHTGSIYTQPGFVGPVIVPLISQAKGGLFVADSVHINCSGQELVQATGIDTDGDGCGDAQERGPDETRGGLRDFSNPWDFYDVAGSGTGGPDGRVDLNNDVLGVVLHFSPNGGGRYDARFDRGPSPGPYAWNMTAPDGVIDLPNDILGVILQFGHNCQ